MHKIEAIILKTKSFEETSHILTLFSKEFGIINLVTKNYASKIARSYSPLIKIETSVKNTQKELWKAESIHIVNAYGNLRFSLVKLELAALMTKALQHILPQKTISSEVYTLFDDHLSALAKTSTPLPVASSFFLKFFYQEGILGTIETESAHETSLFEKLFITQVDALEEIENFSCKALLHKTIVHALPNLQEDIVRVLSK